MSKGRNDIIDVYTAIVQSVLPICLCTMAPRPHNDNDNDNIVYLTKNNSTHKRYTIFWINIL